MSVAFNHSSPYWTKSNLSHAAACSHHKRGACQPARFAGCDVPRLRLQRSLPHPFNAGPVCYITAVLACGIKILVRDFSVPAAIINVTIRPNVTNVTFLFFLSNFEAPLAFAALRTSTAPYRRVFFLPFRRFIFAHFESTIFVAPVKPRAAYPRLQACPGATLVAPRHCPWALPPKVAC